MRSTGIIGDILNDYIPQLYKFHVRWSVIASQLPGRTDNDVKNYWNTKLKKRLLSGDISLPTPNNITATNSCSSTSSVGISNEFAPAKDYNYQGLSVVSGACLEPLTFSTLLTDVHYGPSFMAHSASPEIGSVVDCRGKINSSVLQERSSVNSSGNSPDSLGAAGTNRSVSALVNGEAIGEYGGTNVGFGLSWEMLINELLFDEKAGEVSANALP